MRMFRQFLLPCCYVLALVLMIAVITTFAQHRGSMSPTTPGSARSAGRASMAPGTSPAQASLTILSKTGAVGFCPLRHTDVKAGVSGFLSRVVVTQDFDNPSTGKIEAVYTFPLPAEAAVDDMTIQVGSRMIRGVIKRREEAAAIYQKAIQQGHTAALLDQERPNIFTQTVGNIPPGESVRITISYVTRLKYEDGAYEFSFPMVVGPRYIPGNVAIGQQGGGWSPDTNKVPDASRITPPVAPPGTRAGHDISLSVALDAGVPIHDLRSTTHEIEVDRTGATSALVRLRNAGEIPNKDFVLHYNVAGSAIVEGLLTHTLGGTAARLVPVSNLPVAPQTKGYFTLILQPPDRFPDSDVTSKEIVFVLDSSGSMNGFPEAKAKQFIDKALGGLYPGDTFNVIKFSGDTAILFPEPVYPSADNIRRAHEFVNEDWGHGGTEMMKAIRAALAPSDSQDHLRIVVFLTDGYVGNDMEIVGEVQKHPNARVFAFGIGSAVNRFLLDKMAEAGRGEVQYVSAKQDETEADTAVDRLFERLRAPLLTDIALDFGGLPVTDIYPRRIPDLFSGKPVVVTGRYTAGARGKVRLTGKRAGDEYSREIAVTLPAANDANPVLAALWAREKIDDLMAQDWLGLQRNSMRPELVSEITQLGLDYRLMTQFTSFVAVEERTVTEGGQPKRIEVPVEIPEDVSYEGVFGDRDKLIVKNGMPMPAMKMAMQAPASVSQNVNVTASASVVNGPVGGPSGGSAGGIVGGIIARSPAPPSNGTGTGGGIGTGSGGGVGTGSGPGVGPGFAGGYGGGVYRVGGGVSAPKAIYAPDPEYSEQARQANYHGTVLLSVMVAADGRPRDIKVARSLGMGLDQKAVEAVRKWKFEPARKDGKPVAALINVEVNFRGGGASVTTAAAQATGPRAIDAKMSPDLVRTYDCWQNHPDNSRPAPGCQPDPDRISIIVIASGDRGDLLRALTALGFRWDPKASHGNRFLGTVAVDKLASLAEVKYVQFVTRAAAESAHLRR